MCRCEFTLIILQVFMFLLPCCNGAKIIEKHLTLDKGMEGPDHSSEFRAI